MDVAKLLSGLQNVPKPNSANPMATAQMGGMGGMGGSYGQGFPGGGPMGGGGGAPNAQQLMEYYQCYQQYMMYAPMMYGAQQFPEGQSRGQGFPFAGAEQGPPMGQSGQPGQSDQMYASMYAASMGRFAGGAPGEASHGVGNAALNYARAQPQPGYFYPAYTGNDNHIGVYNTHARKALLEKFHAKRKRRLELAGKKTIRYGIRKNLADSRLRIKGRFVKVAPGSEGTEGVEGSETSEGVEVSELESASDGPETAPPTPERAPLEQEISE